jgi:hypothetical protein
MITNAKQNTGSLPERELDIESLEAYLNTLLGPVKPRQEFVQGLRGRLESTVSHTPKDQPQVQVSSVQLGGSTSLLLILAGLVGSLILLVTGIRATLSLFEAVKSIRHRGQQSGISASRSQTASLIKSASVGN